MSAGVGMQFNNAEIERLVNRSLVIECFEITLIQNIANDPLGFSGPGSITVQSNGRLSLKMYDASKKSGMSGMLRVALYNEVGVVGESEYYSLRATDASGNLRLAPRVYINDGLRLTPHGIIVEFDISDIRTERIRSRQDLDGISIANVVVVGNFRLPFNKWQDQADGSSSVSALDFEIEGVSLKFAQKTKHLEIEVESSTRGIDHQLLMTISEAISIAVGRDVWPAYYRVYKEGVITSFISGKSDIKGLGMIKPFVDVFPYKTAKLISFVDKYVNNRQEKHGYIVSYWRRLYQISSQLGDVAALVLTVNIEGLIHNYFSLGRAPSDTVMAEIALSKKIIKPLKLPASTKSRIKNVLGGMKRLSAPNILRELEKNGVIEAAHVKSWNNLRHSLAHAGNADSDTDTIGLFFVDIENCLDLFYRLIGLSVGYDASIVVSSEDSSSSNFVGQGLKG